MPDIKALVINWETHSKNVIQKFCSMVEHQSLVDVAICCGNSVIRVHKLILASVSTLCKEEFEKEPLIEQILLSGCDFLVIKNIVEIIYLGKTIIKDENVKFVFAMIKLLQINNLENLFNDPQMYDTVDLPKPQFLTKKLKFSYKQTASSTNTDNIESDRSIVPMGISSLYDTLQEKDNLRRQAEQAAIKEAASSRLALHNLQKQITQNPQANNFIIENSCTEAKVENYISSNSNLQKFQDSFVTNSQDDALLLPILIPQNGLIKELSVPGSTNKNITSTISSASIVPSTSTSTLNKNMKIASGNKMHSNVDAVLQNIYHNSGSFSNDALQGLSAKGVHYEVQGKDGSVSLMQELFIMDKLPNEISSSRAHHDTMCSTKPVIEMSHFLNESDGELALQENPCYVINDHDKDAGYLEATDATKSNQNQCKSESNRLVNTDFSPDIFFADMN